MGREASHEFLRYHASRKLGLDTPEDLSKETKLPKSA
jgi:hypothetical protein